MRIVFVISNIGDYHAARLKQLDTDLRGAGQEFIVLAGTGPSAFYKHRQTRGRKLVADLDIRRVPGGSKRGMASGIFRQILALKPDVVVQLGYSDILSYVSLLAGRLAGARVLFLADSKADDGPRSRPKEVLKSAAVRLFDGAVVAGERHKRYFESLGLRGDRIETGYDVVDNGFFAKGAAHARRKSALIQRCTALPPRYVLVVSRLVERKRVPLALEIYARSGLPKSGVSLVLIGDGPERAAVEAKIASLGLAHHVRWYPEVKNSMMPTLYGLAEAVMLVSEFDQWGLSINEAMAAGVPALVSQRCGCAGEIVLHGKNGFVFDGQDVEAASLFLDQLVLDPARQRGFSAAAAETMTDWSLSRLSSAIFRLIGLQPPRVTTYPTFGKDPD